LVTEIYPLPSKILTLKNYPVRNGMLVIGAYRFIGKIQLHSKCTLTPEIDCDQTATGLPPDISAFILAKSFWYNVGVPEEYRRYLYYPFSDKLEWYVCMYV
jgi:hypothetical protein